MKRHAKDVHIDMSAGHNSMVRVKQCAGFRGMSTILKLSRNVVGSWQALEPRDTRGSGSSGAAPGTTPSTTYTPWLCEPHPPVPEVLDFSGVHAYTNKGCSGLVAKDHVILGLLVSLWHSGTLNERKILRLSIQAVNVVSLRNDL